MTVAGGGAGVPGAGVPAAGSAPTPGRRIVIVATAMLSMFLVGLDTTIVNIGMPAIAHAFGTDTRGVAWVVDAYTIVLAGLLITGGALADRFGRKRVFLIGLAVFGIASLLCAFAPTAPLLVAARAVQGVGASMLNPVALAIIVSVVTDPAERARAIGMWSSVFGLSMAAGPILGGVLVEHLGWESLFWINVPVIVLAIALTAGLVPESRAAAPRPLDLPGQALLIVAVGAAVAALIEGPELGWGSPIPLLGLGITAATAVAFVLLEHRRAHPLIDLALFRQPAFTLAVLGAVAAFMATTVVLILNTYSLQQGRGWSAVATGAMVLPLAVGIIVCAPIAGALIGRRGPALPLGLGAAAIVIGAALLIPPIAEPPIAYIGGAYLLIGVGFGLVNAPITNTAVSGLPPERAGVASAVTSTGRQVGAAIGIALGSGIVATQDPAALVETVWPGGLLVALCGAFLLVVAASARRTR